MGSAVRGHQANHLQKAGQQCAKGQMPTLLYQERQPEAQPEKGRKGLYSAPAQRPHSEPSGSRVRAGAGPPAVETITMGPAGAGLGQGPHGPGYRARRARGPRAGAACGGPAQAGGFLPAPPHATRGRGARPPPAAGPHVVDDDGLVGDDVVGLHGRAGPGRPCPAGGRQEKLADAQTGGPDRSGSRRGAAPLPSGARSLREPGAPSRARPAANHRSHPRG